MKCALLQFRNALFLSVNEITGHIAGTITQLKISLNQNQPRMLFIEVFNNCLPFQWFQCTPTIDMKPIENVNISPFTCDFRQIANTLKFFQILVFQSTLLKNYVK